MKTDVVRKSITISIIVLFIGAVLVHAEVNTQIREKNSIYQTMNEINSQNYTNFIGWINITWNNWYTNPLQNLGPKITLTPVSENQRNYSFPVINGKVRMNFTALVTIDQIKYLILPRLTHAADGFGQNSTWGLKMMKRIVWGKNHIPPKNYLLTCIDESEHDTGGSNNWTIYIHLEGAGFPFGNLFTPWMKYIEFPVTVHFIY